MKLPAQAARFMGTFILPVALTLTLFLCDLLLLRNPWSPLTPHERPFLCDDVTLMLPYQQGTIPTWLVLAYCMGLPLLAMVLGEYLHLRTSRGEAEVSRCRSGALTSVTICGRHIPPLMWACYKKIGVFLFGACISQVTTDIAKYSIGRLRPHWFAICQPKLNDALCKESIYGVEMGRYVLPAETECMGNDAYRMREARLSFPSGHASLSMYTMLYLACYLQVRFRWRSAWLLKHFLQVIVLFMAIYTALSRVSDYKHHWSDVLAGSLQGGAVAALVFTYISDLPSRSPSRSHPNTSMVEDGTLGVSVNDSEMVSRGDGRDRVTNGPARHD